MITLLGPIVAEFFKDLKKNLKMVILFVPHGIYQLIKPWKLFKPFDGRAKILSNINACAIAPENDLFIETFFAEVDSDRAILLFMKNAFLQTFLHNFFSKQIGIRLVIYFVKADTEFFI